MNKVFSMAFGEQFTALMAGLTPGRTVDEVLDELSKDFLYTTINDYRECPWPANADRKARCAVCQQSGGFKAWRRGVYTQFDSRVCVQHFGNSGLRDEVKRLLDASGLTPPERAHTFARSTTDPYNRLAMESLQTWSEGEQGMYLCSPLNGVGKTHLLHALILRLCQQGIGALLVRTVDLVADLHHAVSEKQRVEAVLYPLKYAPVLCWDDLGKEGMAAGDFVIEKIYNVIDYRNRAEVPLFVSSNFEYSALEGRFGGNYGPAIVSRLAGMCKVYKLGGPDRRIAHSK